MFDDWRGNMTSRKLFHHLLNSKTHQKIHENRVLVFWHNLSFNFLGHRVRSSSRSLWDDEKNGMKRRNQNVETEKKCNWLIDRHCFLINTDWFSWNSLFFVLPCGRNFLVNQKFSPACKQNYNPTNQYGGRHAKFATTPLSCPNQLASKQKLEPYAKNNRWPGTTS